MLVPNQFRSRSATPISLDMDDFECMLYGMVHLCPHLQQPAPFGGIGNNAITRQPRLQHFDLKLEESDSGTQYESCRGLAARHLLSAYVPKG